VTIDATSQEVYDEMPGYMRAGDEAQLERPLLNYLTAIGVQLHRTAVLNARLNRYEGDPRPDHPSDLMDAEAADAEWLPHLAQYVGARVEQLEDLQARRDAIQFAPAGFRRCTIDAIAGAARSALTGTRFVQVYPHSITSPGDSDWRHMLLVTRTSETPDPAAVLAAVAAQRATPSGVQLHHRAYAATWAQVNAAYPTVGSMRGNTIVQIAETGL
jgi:hypothetical protein